MEYYLNIVLLIAYQSREESLSSMNEGGEHFWWRVASDEDRHDQPRYFINNFI